MLMNIGQEILYTITLMTRSENADLHQYVLDFITIIYFELLAFILIHSDVSKTQPVLNLGA